MNFDSFRKEATSRQNMLRRKVQSAHTQVERGFLLATAFGLPLVFMLIYEVQSFVRFGHFHELPEGNCLNVFLILLAFAGVVPLIRADERVKNLEIVAARLSKARANIDMLEQLIKRNDPFVLYLRGFRSGRNREQPLPIPGASGHGVANPLIWPKEFGNPTTRRVIFTVEQHFAVVLFDSLGERTEFLEGLIVYSDNAHWEENFKGLAEIAKYVVFDIRSPDLDSEGVQRELTYFSGLSARKVILIGTEVDLSAIEKLYPALSERLVLTCKIPNDIEKKREGFRLSELDAFLENAASGNVKL